MTEKIQSARDFACRFVPAQVERVRDRFGSRSLAGSFALNVIGDSAWSFRIREGELEVQPGLEADRLLTVSLVAADFVRFVEAIPSVSEPKTSISLKFLSWDTETASLVRSLSGDILLRVGDEGTPRRILLSPGDRAIDFEAAACTIDCDWGDLMDVQAGKQQPMELFLAGKLRLSGNVELALALAGLVL